MTGEEYQRALQMCALSGGALLEYDLPAMLEAIGRAESVGPLLDPTLYRDKAGAMKLDKELLEAALPLWNKVREMRAKMKSQNA